MRAQIFGARPSLSQLRHRRSRPCQQESHLLDRGHRGGSSRRRLPPPPPPPPCPAYKCSSRQPDRRASLAWARVGPAGGSKLAMLPCPPGVSHPLPQIAWARSRPASRVPPTPGPALSARGAGRAGRDRHDIATDRIRSTPGKSGGPNRTQELWRLGRRGGAAVCRPNIMTSRALRCRIKCRRLGRNRDGRAHNRRRRAPAASPPRCWRSHNLAPQPRDVLQRRLSRC